MKKTEQLFLEALKASLKDERVQWEETMDRESWEQLFRLAGAHHILPLIYEAVYKSPAARAADPALFVGVKQQVVRGVMMQTMQTMEFLQLAKKLEAAGVTPLVVKGMVCRNMYPKPDYRVSGDEDVLIPQEQFSLCHQAMLDAGMVCVDEGKDLEQEDEVTYARVGSPLYIELHKALFPRESDAYGALNTYFEDAFANAIELEVEGGRIRTMGYTDHLLYLIFHAFKHFLHSGFGIRQVCDICLMANTYGKEIDWDYILEKTREVQAEEFTAALFGMGEKYLTFDPEAAGWTAAWQQIEVDVEPLLADLLEGGIYGSADRQRQHSSTITLNAVTAEKQGKNTAPNILKSVFPDARSLKGRYQYLESQPYLLPVAWMDRIIKYGKELGKGNSGMVSDSLRIGEQRVELLRKYGIIR